MVNNSGKQLTAHCHCFVLKQYMYHQPMMGFRHNVYILLCMYKYRIEGNFGGGKLWRIAGKNAFGGINFGEFVVPAD